MGLQIKEKDLPYLIVFRSGMVDRVCRSAHDSQCRLCRRIVFAALTSAAHLIGRKNRGGSRRYIQYQQKSLYGCATLIDINVKPMTRCKYHLIF